MHLGPVPQKCLFSWRTLVHTANTRPDEGSVYVKCMFCDENNLSWSKHASVCTLIHGKVEELVRERADIPDFATFHCIIHQEALLANLSFILSRVLNRRQFCSCKNARQNTETLSWTMRYAGYLIAGCWRGLRVFCLKSTNSFQAKGREEQDLVNPVGTEAGLMDWQGQNNDTSRNSDLISLCPSLQTICFVWS